MGQVQAPQIEGPSFIVVRYFRVVFGTVQEVAQQVVRPTVKGD